MPPGDDQEGTDPDTTDPDSTDAPSTDGQDAALGAEPSTGLGELALLFLRLGTTAFGGPAAHIAMMRDEVVQRRRWMDDRDYLDLVAAANLVPGPNSTEVAIHVGHRQAGWRGLLVAGACFILPAALLVGVLAWAYAEHGTDPAVVDLRYGILPVIVAIVAQALWKLGRAAVKDVVFGVVAVACGVAFLLGVPEIPILLGAAGVAVLWGGREAIFRRGRAAVLAPWALLADPSALPLVLARQPVELDRLFLVFLKIGAVLYGSGYVLIAFLETDLVDRLGWLTEQQLLDAVAIGQVTPGPVFTTATFVGYQVAGWQGATLATIAIFLPAFAFVAALTKIVPWMRRNAWTGHALDGLNAAAVGLIAGVLVVLAGDAFADPFAVVLGVAALAVLLRWQPNSAWLVGAGALVGLARTLL